jgi:hypothetical protein
MQNTIRPIRESAAVQRSFAPQLVNSDVIEELGRAWGKSLSDSITPTPETLTAMREAQSVTADG